jgi:hypothetical protein
VNCQIGEAELSATKLSRLINEQDSVSHIHRDF